MLALNTPIDRCKNIILCLAEAVSVLVKVNGLCVLIVRFVIVYRWLMIAQMCNVITYGPHRKLEHFRRYINLLTYTMGDR